MLIEIVLREPGNHHIIWVGHYPFPPRVGESVVIDVEEAAYTVHKVSHILPENKLSVLVSR
jgi:hypothetical protein